MKTLSTQKKHHTKKIIIISIIAVALIGGGAYAYKLSSDSAKKQDQDTAVKYGSDKTTPSSDTPNSGGSSSGGSISSPKDDTGTSGGSSNTPTNGVTPTTPIGTFVSSHTLKTTSPTNSTCTTSANVSCYIEFKNGSVIRTLPSHQTDSNGNTVWDWKPSDIGLTQGTWSITAVSKNGNLESRASDPMNLEVTP